MRSSYRWVVASAAYIYRPRLGRRTIVGGIIRHHSSPIGVVDSSLFDSVLVLDPTQCTKAGNHLVHRWNIFLCAYIK
jgi:hypothetical protein